MLRIKIIKTCFSKNKKPAFVTLGSYIRAHSLLKKTLSNLAVRQKLMKEIKGGNINAGNLKKELVKLAMNVARDELSTVAKGKLIEALHADMSSLSSTMTSGNK